MTFLQERYTILPALVLVFAAYFSQAQTTEWFVMNDQVGIMTADAIAPDLEGNTYVFGQYQNEAQFNSADTSKLSVTAYARQKEAYLAKYDRSGDLQFVYFVKGSGGSSNYITPGPLTVLADGRVAILFTATSSFELDLSGEKVKGLARTSSVLCIFNTNGALDQMIDVPLTYCHILAQNSQGALYMMGRTNSYSGGGRTQFIAVLDLGATEVRRLDESYPNFEKAMFYKDQIWMLTFEQTETKYNRSRGIYHISTIDAFGTNEVHEKFDKERGFMYSSNMDFLTAGGALQFRVMFQVSGSGTIPFDGGIEVEKGKSLLLVYDEFGKEVARAISSGFRNGARLDGTDDGGYLLTTLSSDTLTLEGEASIPCTRQEPWTGEMIHVKFDSQMQVEWVQKAGGNSMNSGRMCALAIEGNRFYCAMQMNGTATLDIGERSANWGGAMYVRQVKMPE